MFREKSGKTLTTFPEVETALTRWRRRRDSNPCGVSPKRFSRPPRYDHFDTSPNNQLQRLYYITLCTISQGLFQNFLCAIIIFNAAFPFLKDVFIHFFDTIIFHSFWKSGKNPTVFPEIDTAQARWYARCDSNARHIASEAIALSSWATGAYYFDIISYFFPDFKRFWKIFQNLGKNTVQCQLSGE